MLFENQKARFLLVGAYNTVFGYLTFVLLYAWLGTRLHYLIVVLLAYCVAVAHSFTTQRYLVFRERTNLRRAFMRFNAVTALMLAFNLLAMAALVDCIGLHPLLAQAAVTAISAVMVFTIHRRFTFARQHEVE